jgi:small subunit ribosomal protein S8
LAKVLKSEGYIADFSVKEVEKFKILSVTLKYNEKGKPLITKLKRASKPGLRIYMKSQNIPKILGGLGIAIVSTSKGLLTDRKARKENVGGEVLCYVW